MSSTRAGERKIMSQNDKKRTCNSCKNVFEKSTTKKSKRVYGVMEWGEKILVMCKKCLLEDQKKEPNQWKYAKYAWNEFSDIEKLFYITSRNEWEAIENQLEIEKLGTQSWEKIDIIHQWMLMCTINKFGAPSKGDVAKDTPDHDIYSFIHCKKCVNENNDLVFSLSQRICSIVGLFSISAIPFLPRPHTCLP